MSEPEPLSHDWWVRKARADGLYSRLDELDTTLKVLTMYQQDLRTIYDAAPRADILALLERTTERIHDTSEHLSDTLDALEKFGGP